MPEALPEEPLTLSGAYAALAVVAPLSAVATVVVAEAGGAKPVAAEAAPSSAARLVTAALVPEPGRRNRLPSPQAAAAAGAEAVPLADRQVDE